MSGRYYGVGGGQGPSDHRGDHHQRGRQYHQDCSNRPPDRSRSRDGRGGRGGGGYHGRGYSGGGGGGRGGRGGHSLVNRGRLEKEGIKVKTNCFSMKFKDNDVQYEWFQYRVQIQDAELAAEKDENGEKIRGPDNKVKTYYRVKENRRPFFLSSAAGQAVQPGVERGLPQPATAEEVSRANRSSVVTRRILLKCFKDFQEANPPWQFLTDGSQMAYSASEAPTLQQNGGVFVTVKAECEDDYCDADRVKNRHFFVTFRKVGTIPFAVEKDGRIKCEAQNYPKMLQVVNTAFKHAMLRSSMICFGRDPQRWFYPEENQRWFYPEENQSRLYAKNRNPRDFKRFDDRTGSGIQSLVGIGQAAFASKEGTVLKVADLALKYVRRERDSDNQRIPILQANLNRGNHSGTIAGVRVDDLRVPIPPGQKRDEIEQALKKIKFHIIYTCGPDWERRYVERRRAKGHTDERIQQGLEKARTKFRANRSIWRGQQVSETVVEFEPSNHTFTVKDKTDGSETKCTVESYMKQIYDIDFKYPNQPLVRISKVEYFPIEFLYQALDELKDANSDDQKNAALGFHDHHACMERIDFIAKTLKNTRLGLAQVEREALSTLNLAVSGDPMSTTATVLREPSILFRNESTPHTVSDGSFNLLLKSKEPVTFMEPSHLTSVAIVDFVGAGGNHAVRECDHEGCECDHAEPKCLLAVRECLHAVRECLRACWRHGMRLGASVPSDGAGLNRVTVARLGRHVDQGCREAINEAIQTARDVFLEQLPRERGHPHRTTVRINGMLETCLVSRRGDQIEVIPPPPDDMDNDGRVRGWQKGTSHKIRGNPDAPETEYQARLGYSGVYESSGERFAFIDIFHLDRSDNGGFVDITSDGHPLVRLENSVYRTAGGIIPADKVTSVELVCQVSSLSDVCCPSVLFVYLPTKETQRYSFVKFVADYENGVQSQVIVKESFPKQQDGSRQKETFRKQRGGSRQESYCSNIALKLNTKLSSAKSQGTAWKLQLHDLDDANWLAETLVIGIAMAGGQGSEALMVVTGTACLNLSSLQMCHSSVIVRKSSTVPPDALAVIVEDLARHYFMMNLQQPRRVLLYRSGGQDGMFEAIIGNEAEAVRTALANLDKTREQPLAELASKPQVTFIVAQDAHGNKFAPCSESTVWTKRNVPSGTCVHSSDIVNNSGLDGTSGNDFFLHSHGGLKGTSKSVFYRILLNENKDVLNGRVLRQLTYSMSFQYGTATKAPRALSVVQYSTRLSNTALSCLPYLMHDSEDPFVQRRIVDDDAEAMDMGSSIIKRRSGDRSIFPHHSALDFATQEWKQPLHPHMAA